ncbi:MYND finger domain-like protein [Angomonas deanei]|nr:MYND finger domain-like protein [Angomonas deanei]|eukprot:EPY38800.1 MYND finger domain-like protein [Angomonas deanei]
MLKELSGEDRLCSVCKTAEAARLLHHPMLFPGSFPPRIQDVPVQVCGNPECTLQAEAQFMLDMELAQTADGGVGRQRCFKCNKEGAGGKPLMRCSKCKVAKYCSPECQRADWFIHKKVCASASQS